MESITVIPTERIRKSQAESFEEEILSNRELMPGSRDLKGRNITQFITLKDDGSAVFKPKNGEKLQRPRIEPGTYYKRERAAYLVDKFIGFELVPPTVIRAIEGEVGSAQQFIPGAMEVGDAWRAYRRPSIDDPEAASKESQIASLALFDYLIFNSDRHLGNALVKDGRMRAIDHGLAFADSYYRNEALLDGKDVAWLCGEPIPEGTRDKIKNFLKWEDGQRILRDLLTELLSEREVDAFFKRFAKVSMLIEKGTFPPKETVYEELTFDGAPRKQQETY